MTPRLLCGKAILITVNHITLEDKLVSELLISYPLFLFIYFFLGLSAVLLTPQKAPSQTALEKIVERVLQKSAVQIC